MTEAHHGRSQIRTAIGLLFCVAGIYGAYLTQGVVQETLSTKRFGPEGRRFTHLPALNGFQSWACFLWAFVLINVFQRGHSEGLPPITAYCRPAISNSIGPALGMQALRYISYPAQVLAKSSKMIPVMLMGTLLHAKSYSALEYACCLLISGGISLFAMRSSSKVTSKLAQPNAPLGYFLCFANLTLDGYTNAAQDRDPPAAGYDIVLFCLCGAIGQLFIFQTIRRFGSLVNTLVTTTRKFFNILLSVIWSGNPLLPQQWAAVFMVFGGLLTSSIHKSRRARYPAAPGKTKAA
ncbi:hypothetical protein QBZ16_000402 [Prototheca wickerhamii]|uniref:UAA transporter n=1 Tax=Prototheca wickerhamii TaxID=3111 RepID=A0AAD9MIQ4_PROWI|nr:hypothetical protein QBZ16_000402 [Prototheca wickerhamii]